jgi:hypothetical protein
VSVKKIGLKCGGSAEGVKKKKKRENRYSEVSVKKMGLEGEEGC